MRGVNKAIIVGNLGADPDVRYMPGSQKAVANLSVATNERWRDRETGEQHERTEWHRVSMFGSMAEVAGQYLRKGSKVYIEGKLRTRKWQGQDGIDRFTTEINALDMQMLDSGDGQSAFQQRQPQNQQPAQNQGTESRAAEGPTDEADFDDDIPF